MAALPLSVPRGYHIRIPPTSFIASIVTFHIIATISALIRTAFSYHVHGTLLIDDYLLIFALICLCVTAGVAYSIKELVYLQIYVGLGWQPPTPDLDSRMLDFEKKVQVCSVLVWMAIYAVKFSFLAFFRKLIRRVHLLYPWWWIVFAGLLVGGVVSLPLAFIICSNFSQDYIEHCPIGYQLHNERVYLITTTVFDVITDVMVISIPVALIWKAKLNLRRKLVIGSMLCLSVVMILVAITRTSLADLPNGVVDTSWLFFWQGIEAACGVIMVSLTSFRSLFGQQKKNAQDKLEKKSQLSHSSSRSYRNIERISQNNLEPNCNMDGGNMPLLVVPSAARTK